MIEEQLMNYGILGLWTLSLIIEKYKILNRISVAIDENTEATERLSGWINVLVRKKQ